MAQKTQVVLVDDLDGSDATETVRFGLDSRFYEMDLNAENAKALREALKPYMRKARAVGPPSPESEAREIREWARDNGYEVASRGRLHRDIVQAYRNAKKR